MCLSDEGRNKSEKIEEYGDKKGWACVGGWLVCSLVRPCPAPEEHSLSSPHIKHHF